MSKGALILALGLCSFCFPLAAQQAKNSGKAKHRITASAVQPLDSVSNLSIYRPNVVNASDSILFHNGPVRAWSDGAQLVSESAFVQIGMAPFGLFPVSYFAPADVAPAPMKKPITASDSRSGNLSTDGKDLPAAMLDSPLSHVYYTGEVGFVRPMERQRQRRLRGELCLGPGTATINYRFQPALRSKTGAATQRKFALIHFRDKRVHDAERGNRVDRGFSRRCLLVRDRCKEKVPANVSISQRVEAGFVLAERRVSIVFLFRR